METKEILIAKAKVVIIATGGAGRMHYQGFPTSNHYGATADDVVVAGGSITATSGNVNFEAGGNVAIDAEVIEAALNVTVQAGNAVNVNNKFHKAL